MEAQVDIRLAPDGHHQLMLNGQDISSCIAGVIFEGRPGPDSTLVLQIYAPSITVAGQLRVLLSDDTRSMLVGLGWTPPAEN